MSPRKIQESLLRLGAKVKILRKELGFSQEELADRSSLHRTYITDIERGKRNPTLESTVRLAEALKVPLSILFKGIEDQKPQKPHFTGKTGTDGRTANGQPVEILLATSDRALIKHIPHLLNAHGVRNPVRIVEDVTDAFRIFRRKTQGVDGKDGRNVLLFVDEDNCSISGAEVLQSLRFGNRIPGLRVIFVGSGRNPPFLSHDRHKGIAGRIKKPLKAEEFFSAIQTLGLYVILAAELKMGSHTATRIEGSVHRKPLK